MITFHLRYIVDPDKLAEFGHYGKLWIPLVRKYEQYRHQSFADPECQAVFRYAKETRCFLSHERTFFRPVFE